MVGNENMPLEFYLIILGIILGGIVLGFYIYRKIKPKIENLAESVERNPPKFEDLGAKIKSKLDSALSSESLLDSKSDEHPQITGQEDLEDVAAALATEQYHLKEEDEEYVAFSWGTNMLCLANVLAVLILFLVFIWEDLTAGYSFEDTFENVLLTAIVVSPLLLIAGFEYKLFTIRKNGYDTKWFYVIEALIGTTLGVVAYFVATRGPSEVWNYFLGAWFALGLCVYAWQRMDPDSDASRLWRYQSERERRIQSRSMDRQSYFKQKERGANSNSTSKSSFGTSRQKKQKEKQAPARKTVWVVKVRYPSGGMAKAGEFPTVEQAEWRADQLRKQGSRGKQATQVMVYPEQK